MTARDMALLQKSPVLACPEFTINQEGEMKFRQEWNAEKTALARKTSIFDGRGAFLNKSYRLVQE